MNESLRWLASRLRNVTAAEIPHRVREVARRALDRRGVAPPVVPPGLLARDVPGWPVPSGREVSEPWRHRLRAEVDGLLAGRLRLLGNDWPRGAERDWHLDPATGTRWPAEPVLGIAWRRDPGGRDPKPTWELNRLPHLQVLALGAALLDDARARDACLAELAAWLRAHPPFQGIAWASGIECAHRIVSFLVVGGLLGPSSLSEETRRALWRALAAHASWIARYPSRYSSGNNHRVAELTALHLLGRLAPELPGLPHPAATRHELEERARALVLADGAGAEQSTAYLAYTLEWLLVARHVGGLDVDATLADGAAFLAGLCDEGGHLPRIGDDDDAAVLRQTLARDVLGPSVGRAVAQVLGRDDLVPPASEPDLRGLLLGGAPVVPRPDRSSRHHPQGGYTVLASPPFRVVFDHGPLGWEPLAAHGHADALALWLHVGERPVVVGRGTYRYNHAPAWRAWARGTSAHSTVTLDGRDQTPQSGPFTWGRRARTRLVEADLGRGRVVAEHDGYRPVVHRRIVEAHDGAVRVEDRISGTGRHQVVLAWHLAPDLDVRRVGEHFETADLRIEVEGLPGTVVVDGRRPGPGTHSPAYGVLEPAPTLWFEGAVELPVRLVTRFLQRAP